MDTYIGNALPIAVEEPRSNCERTEADIYSRLCAEQTRSNLLVPFDALHKMVLGQGGPAIFVLSARTLPMAEVGFGFSSAVPSTVCSIIQGHGIGGQRNLGLICYPVAGEV
ncbi:hypothetical protein H5410_055257 [Solanum commersonii]|uniref:Uncharacterized protein n=1 Tax=Solanum commersonii TaxID=4109 RepID=A0A9J5WH40_SOLCO|nr:hypothetical protein H5410_055257 [Solanum commersonii]